MSETQTTPPAVETVPPAIVAAPVPLTAVPAIVAAPVEEAPVKRKYTKRAVKAAAPKVKKAKMRTKSKVRKIKAKAPKAEKKAKRVAGVKAQGQIPKSAMRFAKATAKEEGITCGALFGKGIVKYLKSLGWDPEA